MGHQIHWIAVLLEIKEEQHQGGEAAGYEEYLKTLMLQTLTADQGEVDGGDHHHHHSDKGGVLLGPELISKPGGRCDSCIRPEEEGNELQVVTIEGRVASRNGSGEYRSDEACCRAVRRNWSISADEMGRDGATSHGGVGEITR